MSPEKELPTSTTASVTSKAVSRPHRLTVRVSDETLAVLDQELAVEGKEDRAELVERLLREHVQRRKREQTYLKQEGRVLTTKSGRKVQVHSPHRFLRPGGVEQQLTVETWREEERIALRHSKSRRFFSAEKELKGAVLRVCALETEGTQEKVRDLVVQYFHKVSEETWCFGPKIVLHRPSLLWLIDSLLQAEQAFQDESSRNRKKAHKKRADRTAEEVAREMELRRTYIERYSKERVTKAIALATYHRTRAQRRKLTEHFTPWQWLDLCALSDFRCISCGAQVNLEPHHRVELAGNGSNTIDNLDPLCRSCHRGGPLELGPQEMAELWAFQQQKLFQSFQVGDQVCLGAWGTRVGEILELFPAQRGSEIPPMPLGSRKIRWHGATAHDWIEAKARVSWPWGKSSRKTVVELRELVKGDDDETPPDY